ncbi:MAG TPA: putative motility protein [Pseudomonas sp.]|nr:putative motility protein [Pseudomonas sp.]
MELNISQVSTQAAAQASALASLLLLRKTLELQGANTSGLVQIATPTSAPSHPPNLGNVIDAQVYNVGRVSRRRNPPSDVSIPTKAMFPPRQSAAQRGSELGSARVK